MYGEICVSKSIGLACSGKEIYHFCFVSLCIRGQIPSTSPPRGAYIRRGDLTEGFFASRFWGTYIWKGLYLEGLSFGILRYFKKTSFYLVLFFTLQWSHLTCLRGRHENVFTAYYSQ